MAWRPLSQRGGVDSDYDALHEGVPPWLKGTLLEWLRWAFYPSGVLGREVDLELLREAERRVRDLVLGGPADEIALLRSCMRDLAEDDDLLLDVLDFVVMRMSRDDTYLPSAVVELDTALAQGGSVWRVAHYPENRYACLERRVDETVTAAARGVIGASGRAGQYLAQAWNEAHGRDPSPGEAYRHAVRAVEVAAIPVVTPNDGSATLGKVIAAMREAPQKWCVALTPTDGSDPVEVVRRMCELLWRSQWDRHGVPDDSVPLEVSPEEAEAAVHLATTLVQWFAGGIVKSR